MAANILRTCLYEIWIHLLRSDGVERLQLSDPLIVARDLVAFLKTDRMVFVVGQLGYPDVSTIPGLEIPRPGLGRELAGRLGAAMVVRIREQNRGVREGVLEWCSGVLRGRFRRPVG